MTRQAHCGSSSPRSSPSSPSPAPASTDADCDVHAETTLWNTLGTANGEVDYLTIDAPCPVSVKGALGYAEVCEIASAFSSNFWWHLHTSETSARIEEANFSETLSGCPEGFPGAVSASGTATGTVANGTYQACIEFGESGDLEAPGGIKATLDGSLCATNLTLK